MNYDKLKFYHWVEPDIRYQLTSINANEYMSSLGMKMGAFHTDDAIYSKKGD